MTGGARRAASTMKHDQKKKSKKTNRKGREKKRRFTAVKSLTRCAAATCCVRCVGTLGPAVAFGVGGYGARGAVRRRCALRAGGEKDGEKEEI